MTKFNFLLRFESNLLFIDFFYINPNPAVEFSMSQL